jgi:hypothetical protein
LLTKKRRPLLRSRRPLPRRPSQSLLRRRRKDPRPLLPRRLTLLALMALSVLRSQLPEVAEVAVVVEVAREEAEVVKEAAAVDVVAKDVGPDLRVRKAREDPDLKEVSVVAEARDLKVLKVNSALELRVAEVRDTKVPKVSSAPDLKVDSVVAEARDRKVLKVNSAPELRVDSVVAEARDLKVQKVSSAPELRVVEAEDPPELKGTVRMVRIPFSVPERRELSVMVSTASKARRESNSIPSTEKMELEEEGVLPRAAPVRATGAPLKRR